MNLIRDRGVGVPLGTPTVVAALAVGFWRIEDDRIDMQILTTEASLPQNLQDQVPGEYHALAVRGLVFMSPTTPFVWFRTSRESYAA